MSQFSLRLITAVLVGCLTIILASYAAVLTVAAQTAPAPSATETARGRLSGRVLDESGQPMANVTVLAEAEGLSQFVRASEAVTNAEGRFRFPDLPLGVYRLRPYLAGYVMDTDPDAPPLTYRVGENALLQVVKGGVITGQITDARGGPLVALPVQAVSVRPAATNAPVAEPFYTDDRGIYRIYGLKAGEYLVLAGQNPWVWPPNPYGLNVPVYYPSGTAREAATTVKVALGAEVSGIDLRYLYESGHTVAGQASGLTAGQYPTFTLTPQNGGTASTTFLANGAQEGPNSFAFPAVPDGTYQLLVQTVADNKTLAATQTVVVKGADVTGLSLTVKPLAELRGRLTIVSEKPPDCGADARLTGPEVLLRAHRTDSATSAGNVAQPFSYAQTTGGTQGAFALANLSGGTYRLGWRIPAAWYVRALQPANAKQTEPPQLFTLTDGAALNGANVEIAYGAATIAGNVQPATEGAALPAKLRVYAVPAEPAQADNTLRYADAEVTAAGAFEFANLAPGRYWLIAQTPDAQERAPRWLNAPARAKLRRAVEKLTAIELRPCQQLKAHSVGLN